MENIFILESSKNSNVDKTIEKFFSRLDLPRSWRLKCPFYVDFLKLPSCIFLSLALLNFIRVRQRNFRILKIVKIQSSSENIEKLFLQLDWS